MVTLYACLGSGNCFKPWLVLHQVSKEFELTLIDVLRGEQKEADYLAINPRGVVPYLCDEAGVSIGESNAMIWYLSEGTSLMPQTAADRAETLQWMFFEQSKLEPFIAPARYFTTISPDQSEPRLAEINLWQAKARQGLGTFETHLAHRKFVLKSGYSIADIALFGYVHTIAEAGLDWANYKNIARWVADVEKTANFRPLSCLGHSADQPLQLAS